MNEKFIQEFDALLVKYSELLTGNTSTEVIDKIKVMAIYNYLSKTMPPLVNHWNQMHPDARDDIKNIFAEIKQLNEDLKK